jgi:hypothetical protein
MKKNIALVIISLLLLFSLLMNAVLIYIIYDERVIEDYKTLHCHEQMELTKKLENECFGVIKAIRADSLKNAGVK